MSPYRSSSTARLIARCTLLAAGDPGQHLLVPPAAIDPLRAMLAAGGGGAWFRWALRSRWTRTCLRALEHLMLPGISTHYLARKRWIESVSRRALARGVTQLVVLGAGFDSLAWRLHREYPAVPCFELDHPATQAAKRRALRPAANLTYLPIDFGTDSPAATLRACPAFSRIKPTLIIAEGLLMYFPEQRVTALLGELAGLTRPPAEMLFSYMAQSADGSISFRGEHTAVRWWLRWRHEPFQWGLPTATLPTFLQHCQWRLTAQADHDVLLAQILAPLGLSGLPLARGECLAHCTAFHQ
ncbi:MAG: SAM-dependent methyltransferase [Opitutae bacterium]